jgi:exosortase/archaeosortase family protein
MKLGDSQKRTFKYILIGLVILLVTLPFVTTFNSILTNLVNRVGIYHVLQNSVVPVESRLVVAVVRLFGVPAYMGKASLGASFYVEKGGEYLPIRIEWNCIGWQSLLLLLISFVVGFQSKFSGISKLKCVTVGLLGTFLINILRMVFIVIGTFYWTPIFVLLIHDYFAALVTVLWLLFFWWFSYKFILEETSSV